MNMAKLFYKDGVLYVKQLYNVDEPTYIDKNYSNLVRYYVENGYFQVVFRKKDFYEIINKLLCKYEYVDINVVRNDNIIYGQDIPCSYSMFVRYSNIDILKSLDENCIIDQIYFTNTNDVFVIHNSGLMYYCSSDEELGYVVDTIEYVIGDLYDNL